MPRVKIRICPLCGFETNSGSGLQRHIKACKKRPSNDDLRQYVEDSFTITELREMFQCSDVTLRTWLAEIGQEDYRKGAGKVAPKERVDAWAIKNLMYELAPLFNEVPGGCRNCEHTEMCLSYLRTPYWFPCEAPTKYEYEMAKAYGLHQQNQAGD